MATATNTTNPSETAALRVAASTIGIRAAIKAARQPRPYPDVKAAPVRRFVSIACTMEVQHAKSDFDRLVSAMGATGAFDAEFERHADVAFRLPHEARAGEALLWLSHLQAHDSDRRGPWERWSRMSPEGKSNWLARRRTLLHGLIRAAAAYRAARASIEGGR